MQTWFQRRVNVSVYVASAVGVHVVCLQLLWTL